MNTINAEGKRRNENMDGFPYSRHEELSQGVIVPRVVIPRVVVSRIIVQGVVGPR